MLRRIVMTFAALLMTQAIAEASTLYAAGRYGRIWRSTDSGATWEVVSMMNDIPWWFGVNPANGVLYYLDGGYSSDCANGVLRVSFDGGEKWDDAAPWPGDWRTCVHGIFVTSDGVIVALLRLHDGPTGIWISDDDGASWDEFMVYEQDPPNFIYVRFMTGSSIDMPTGSIPMSWGRLKALFKAGPSSK
jgi:photosystem II stability/assembly factor-like uncharacterized protein